MTLSSSSRSLIDLSSTPLGPIEKSSQSNVHAIVPETSNTKAPTLLQLASSRQKSRSEASLSEDDSYATNEASSSAENWLDCLDELPHSDLFSWYASLETCRQLAGRGQLEAIGWRGLFYRQWFYEQNESNRQDYEKIQNQYKSPLSQSNHDPLSVDASNPWHQHHANQQLLALLQQDIERTFPEWPLFRRKDVQALLQSILFHFVKQYSSIGYKQGMHEVAAVALYLVGQDVKNLRKCALQEREKVATWIHEKFIEADTFALLKAIMSSLLSIYDSPNIQTMSHFVFHTLLQKYDTPLYQHGLDLKLEPTFFTLRWFRLLFCRESKDLKKVLLLWDAYLADRELLPFLATSLLIVVRPTLLACRDESTLLAKIMKPLLDDASLERAPEKIVVLAKNIKEKEKMFEKVKMNERQKSDEKLSNVVNEVVLESSIEKCENVQSVQNEKKETDLVILEKCQAILSNQIPLIQEEKVLRELIKVIRALNGLTNKQPVDAVMKQLE